MRKRSLRGVNEHFDPIFNAVLPSAGTFQTSPRLSCCTEKPPPIGGGLSLMGDQPSRLDSGDGKEDAARRASDGRVVRGDRGVSGEPP
ncbi:hypothetical protein EBB56_15120 [Halomonas sp. YLB-10]|nr:hypothetical protein EBB56_15120 [Halomonas sp. YLB-10]